LLCRYGDSRRPSLELISRVSQSEDHWNLWYSDNKDYVLRYFSAEHDRRSGSVDADELAEDARLPKLPGL
jgi:hypothetical protein